MNNGIPLLQKAAAPDLRQVAAMRQAHDFQMRVLLAQLAAQLAGPMLATDLGFAMHEANEKASVMGQEEGTPLEIQFNCRQSVDQALVAAEYLLGTLGLLPTPAATDEASEASAGQ